MMQTRAALPALMLLIGLPGSLLAAEYPGLIRIFVVGKPVRIDHPEIDIRIYDLSTLGQTAHALSQNLSPRQTIAKVQAQARIEQGLDEVKRNLHSEFELRMLLDRFEIERYPAAVIDDEVLIYGKLSLPEMIDAWRAKQNSR